MAHLTKFSFEFFYEIFTEDASLFVLYHSAKKSKMTKNSNQEGGGGPALKKLFRATTAAWPQTTLESSFTEEVLHFSLHSEGGGDKNCNNSHKKSFFVAVGAIFFTSPSLRWSNTFQCLCKGAVPTQGEKRRGKLVKYGKSDKTNVRGVHRSCPKERCWWSVIDIFSLTSSEER